MEILFAVAVLLAIALIVDEVRRNRAFKGIEKAAESHRAAVEHEWAQSAFDTSSRCRESLQGMEEEMEEMRCLLAEVCRAVRGLHSAGRREVPEAQSWYNNLEQLERLAVEATRRYEEGRPGKLRYISFSPRYGGSE